MNDTLSESSQEKPKSGKGGMSTRTKAAIGIVLVVIIIMIAAVLTLNVTVTYPEQGALYPYTTSYAVTFPEGQQVTIGNTHIVVLSYQNELVADVDGNREKLIYGQDQVLTEHGATITMLTLPILQTNFRINLTYKGERDNLAYFDMTINTQRQVPEFVLKHLLPAAINAQPV